jgi:hypothetical protein
MLTDQMLRDKDHGMLRMLTAFIPILAATMLYSYIWPLQAPSIMGALFVCNVLVLELCQTSSGTRSKRYLKVSHRPISRPRCAVTAKCYAIQWAHRIPSDLGEAAIHDSLLSLEKRTTQIEHLVWYAPTQIISEHERVEWHPFPAGERNEDDKSVMQGVLNATCSKIHSALLVLVPSGRWAGSMRVE